MTATTFACTDFDVAKRLAADASTATYGIRPSDDEVGVELCAALKNVYAIALGIADGLGEASGIPRHNLKAATFAQAIREMSILVDRAGGHAETPMVSPELGTSRSPDCPAETSCTAFTLARESIPMAPWRP